MQLTGKMGLADLGVLRAKMALGGAEGDSRWQKLELAGSKDGVWVHNRTVRWNPKWKPRGITVDDQASLGSREVLASD